MEYYTAFSVPSWELLQDILRDKSVRCQWVLYGAIFGTKKGGYKNETMEGYPGHE